MALTDSLISFWDLEESSGTRNDSHGTNHLTDNNTVLSGIGIVGMAADFELDNDESLSITDNTSVSTGDIDFSFAFWVKLETKPGATMQMVTKESLSDGDYEIFWDNVSDRFSTKVWRSASFGNQTQVYANNFGAPSTGVWYFVVFWHDSIANTINIQINDGAVDSQAHTLGVFDSTGAFSLGRSQSYGFPLDGMMDQVGFWKRVLTSDERTRLYNSGNGLSYAAMTTAFAGGSSLFAAGRFEGGELSIGDEHRWF